MSEVMVSAFERAAASPSAIHEPRGTLLEDLIDPSSGDVGEAKSEILSEVDHSKSEASPEDEDPANRVVEVAGALTEMITDLTTWQITWNVAQSAQKDMAHVLKSS